MNYSGRSQSNEYDNDDPTILVEPLLQLQFLVMDRSGRAIAHPTLRTYLE
jgi:hypothetical protein